MYEQDDEHSPKTVFVAEKKKQDVLAVGQTSLFNASKEN